MARDRLPEAVADEGRIVAPAPQKADEEAHDRAVGETKRQRSCRPRSARGSEPRAPGSSSAGW
jgi:hypothetical protein